jgi:predicted kinase
VARRARLDATRLLTERPLLVVVAGPPGSGKTTIADGIRQRTGLPLIAKDTIKEILGELLGVIEPADSKRLGSAVFALIGHLVRELLEQRVSLIAEGNFAVGYRLFDDLPSARIVQVHVTAPAEVLFARMRKRNTERHPVHWDAEAEDEIAERLARGEWEPLPLGGDLIRIDTSAAPDLDAVLASLASRA